MTVINLSNRRQQHRVKNKGQIWRVKVACSYKTVESFLVLKFDISNKTTSKQQIWSIHMSSELALQYIRS